MIGSLSFYGTMTVCLKNQSIVHTTQTVHHGKESSLACFLFSSPRASHQILSSSVDSCLHLLLLLSEGLRESVHRLLVPERHHFSHLLKLSAEDQFFVSHLILWLSTDSSAECVCQVHL